MNVNVYNATYYATYAALETLGVPRQHIYAIASAAAVAAGEKAVKVAEANGLNSEDR